MAIRDADGVPIRQLSTRRIYENPWLSMREDRIERQDGSRGIYSVIESPDFAVIIPSEHGGFHMVDQYRYPIAGRYWEFPQGTFPNRGVGDPAVLARRELAEETGLRTRSLTHLGHLFGAHGISGHGFNVFLATDLEQGSPSREVEEQDMRHQWFSRAEFERMIVNGQIKDDATTAAYTLLLLHERGAAAAA